MMNPENRVAVDGTGRNRRIVVGVIALALCCGSVAGTATAQQSITASGLNTQVTFSGAQYDITGGTRPGGGANLFHSFGDFGLPTSTMANFLNDTALPTTNILARVTGGNVSTINGKIQTNGAGGFGNANLYLINPSGVVFGAGASLNVGGAFRVSTADYMRMTDGLRFYSNLTNESTLSSQPVVAFGFLAGNPVMGITATSTVSAALLEVPVGNTLSLIGGDITINGPSSSASPTLGARSGRIELVSVASAGEVLLAAENGTPAFSTAGFATLGNVNIANGSRVTVAAPTGFATPAGTILIRGGRLIVDGASSLIASTGGNTNAAPVAVDVQTRESVTLTNGSTIAATNQSPVTGIGNAGEIKIVSETAATPMALEISNNAAINAFYFNNGKAADVTLDAGSIKLLTGGQINEVNQGSSNSGNGGLISLRAAQDIYFGPNTSITAQNFNGTGAGAQIALTAPSVTLEGAGPTQQAVIKGFTGGFGAASPVTFNVGTLELKGTDAIVNTKAQTTSVLGNPPTQGGGPILVQGTGGAGTAASSVMLSGARTAFLSETEGRGNGGNMTVNAHAMTVTDSARVSANTINTGNAGTVTLNVGTLNVSNGGRIEGNTSSTGASINGVFTNGGKGGTIVVQGLASPAQAVTITGAGSGLFSTTSGTGAGGSITVNTNQASITNGGTMSAASSGTANGSGNAGSIQINSQENPGVQLYMNNGSITTQTENAGGGGIKLYMTDMVQMVNSKITTSVRGGDANAGNIFIDPQYVILQGSDIIAQAYGGNGGNIDIFAGTFLADPNSTVNASSALGNPGEVNIQTPVNNLKGTLAPLPGETLEVANLLQSSCMARLRGEQVSSLIQRGRDEAPAGPGEIMQFPLFASAAFPTQAQGAGRGARGEGPGEIEEARGKWLEASGNPLVPSLASLAGQSRLSPLASGLVPGSRSNELQLRGLSRLLAGVGAEGSCKAA